MNTGLILAIVAAVSFSALFNQPENRAFHPERFYRHGGDAGGYLFAFPVGPPARQGFVIRFLNIFQHFSRVDSFNYSFFVIC
jgi:hypothetical protein